MKKSLTGLIVVLHFFTVSQAAALNSVFTYQGRLTDDGTPANGGYDLTFQLFDAATNGNPVGVTITNAGVTAANGLFMTLLDFGVDAFEDGARWLEISARTNGAVSFITLSPRQPLTPTPYSIQAVNAEGIRTAVGQTFILSVDTLPALRIEPTAERGSFNIIGGPAVNSVAQGVVGATIFGGAVTNAPDSLFMNQVNGNFGTISGGGGNTIGGSQFSTISGGAHNSVEGNSESSTIGGGSGNWITGSSSTISGGRLNAISADYSAIGGGGGNSIQRGAENATIAGGFGNLISADATVSTIAGGRGNTIFAAAYWSSIGGGFRNAVQTNSGGATVSGGFENIIQTDARYTVIASGYRNLIGTNASFAAISGGISNAVGSSESTIGGGIGNMIQTNAVKATISGGSENAIQDDAAGATIAGGFGNTIGRNAQDSVIGGGFTNSIQSNAFNSTISGGIRNFIGALAQAGTVSGGHYNSIASNVFYATIGGGSFNSVRTGAQDSTIGGGESNIILTNASHSTIAGGLANLIETNASYASVGGGRQNVIQSRALFATIGGGDGNSIGSSASHATVPGGEANRAGGQFSFAAGRRANAAHDGAFVWADATDADFSSSATSEFSVRATGGVRFVSGVDGGGLPAVGVELASGSGSWSSMSDRNAKTNFTAVDSREVLEQLARIPVRTWSYKTEQPSTRHMGPTAQDFAEAFGVGTDNRHIATVDADGVALAAIQGLNQKLDEKLREQQAELKVKGEQIAALEASVTELKSAMSRLLADRK